MLCSPMQEAKTHQAGMLVFECVTEDSTASLGSMKIAGLTSSSWVESC